MRSSQTAPVSWSTSYLLREPLGISMITSISTARCPLPVGSAAPAAHRTGGVQPAACPGRDWLPSGGGKGSVGSVAGQFVGGVLSGLGGAAQEVGDELELGVGVAGEERIHRGIHPGVQAVQLLAPVGQGADGDGAAIGGVGVAVAGDPAAALESVQDAGDGRGVQASASGQGAGAERAVAVDEVQAVQVDVIEVEMGADVVIEQRELDAQLAQRLLDRGGQPSSVSRAGLLRLRYVAHMI